MKLKLPCDLTDLSHDEVRSKLLQLYEENEPNFKFIEAFHVSRDYNMDKSLVCTLIFSLPLLPSVPADRTAAGLGAFGRG